MNYILDKIARYPNYLHYLGKEQATLVLQNFEAIEAGKYQKQEMLAINMAGFKQPIFIRCIRADMQSFVNTFIEPYLDKKPYMHDCRFVVDAGANIGLTAVLYAQWWPECKIISLEADQENYELAVKNTMAYPNIHVIKKALWNKSALLKIEAGQEDGFVVREVGAEIQSVEQVNTTEGISLMDLMFQHECAQIDFLKMNIEGSEKEVFSEGSDFWLPKTKSMLIELHDGKNAGCSQAVFSAIHKYHFAVAETAAYGILFVEEKAYRAWYAKWYKEEIYEPNINKNRFPNFYLDKEN